MFSNYFQNVFAAKFVPQRGALFVEKFRTTKPSAPEGYTFYYIKDCYPIQVFCFPVRGYFLENPVHRDELYHT